MKKLMKHKWLRVLVVLFVFYALYTAWWNAVHWDDVNAKNPTVTVQKTTPNVSDVNISELYKLTNQDRANAGLPALELSGALQQSATDRCDDMVKYHYFEHDAPSGKKWYTFINKYTYYDQAGENIFDTYVATNAGAVNDGWMNSPTHKENILNPTFTHVSFAVCKVVGVDDYKGPVVIVVEHFMDEYDAKTTNNASRPVPRPYTGIHCSSTSVFSTTYTSCY